MKAEGFTFVEIVLSVFLIGLLFLFSGLLMNRGLDSYVLVSERGKNLQETRAALDRITRELIRIGYDGNFISSITPTQVGYTDDLGLTTLISLSNQTLLRNNDPLLQNVTGFTVTGFDALNNIATTGTNVRRLRFLISTLPPGQTTPLTVQTDVFIRNYMYDNFQ